MGRGELSEVTSPRDWQEGQKRTKMLISYLAVAEAANFQTPEFLEAQTTDFEWGNHSGVWHQGLGRIFCRCYPDLWKRSRVIINNYSFILRFKV